MSYRKSWSETFKTSKFIVKDCLIMGCAVECPDHAPYCFKAEAPAGTESGGRAYLLDPLPIPIIMPGTKQKILTVSVKSMLTAFSGWYGAESSIRLVADGAIIFERPVYHYGDKWRDNIFEPLLDISTVKNLDVQLYLAAHGFWVGWCTLHCAEVTLSAEYYSDVPPVTADVKLTVTNSKTGALIKGAYVALMSGARVVANGYTDGGEVLFENIDEGSYTVRVLAGGYYDFEQSIEVVSPSVWYEIKIVPIPVEPIPTWLWYVVGGVAVLGAITVIPSIIKRKGEERVIVVR